MSDEQADWPWERAERLIALLDEYAALLDGYDDEDQGGG